MADPEVVLAVIDRLRAAAGGALLVRLDAIEGAIARALDAGMLGPAIVSILANPAHLSKIGPNVEVGNVAIGVLDAVIEAQRQQRATDIETVKRGEAATAAGFTPAPAPRPIAPQGGGGQTAYEKLAADETYAGRSFSKNANGTVNAFSGNDMFTFDVSGTDPILVGVNGEPVGPGGVGSGDRGFAPQYDPYTEETTGDRVFVTNGVVTGRIPGATWATLSPAQQQAADAVARKQIDDAAMARQQASDVAAAQRSAAGDVAAGQRAAAQETGANERARLQAATAGFGDVVRLAPQLGQLALSNAGFTRDVLRTAPDYLARAFFQQGQTSPLPQVSQADIINQLRSNIQGFNTTLQGFNPQEGGLPPPPDAPNPAPPTPPAPPSPATDINSAFYSPAAIAGRVAASRAAGSGAGGGGFAHGGFTTAPMMRVGEEPSGAQNATEETVVNPTRAPLGIVPNAQTKQGMHRMPDGSMMADSQMEPDNPEMVADEAKIKAMSKMIGFVENPGTLHALVDEMSDARMKVKRGKQGPRNMPRYANGTGLWGFSIPQLPVPDVARQADIQALERRVRPPALNTLFGGGAPAEPRFGFNLFTPMQLAALTPDDRAALGTTLATQFNETPENVEAAIARRWSTGNRRTAAAVGF